MTHSRLSTELDASPEAVWELVGNIRRWPDWDVTYQPVDLDELDADSSNVYVLEHHLGNRSMRIDFQTTSVRAPELLEVTGSGGAGEQVEERFELEPGKNGGTTLTRETSYTLPGQTLGVAATTTYAEASVQRWAEQAFARLGHLLGDAAKAHATRRPGDVDTRSTDSGPISAEEDYSANLEQGSRLPQAPRGAAPERPT